MAFELPNMIERPSSPTLGELAEDLQAKIGLYRTSKELSPELSPKSHTLAAVSEPAQHTSRTLLGPIAAVEISPAYPDYMVVGTYALLKAGEQGVSVGQVRTGSISVVPVVVGFKPVYPGAVAPFLDEKCLNAAVLDIHFHPSDNTFLGVAMSNAKVTFFRLVKHANVLARRLEMRLVLLGSVKVAEPNEHGETPLVTSFCWLPGSFYTRKAGAYDYHTVSFAATVSNGDVKIVRAEVAGVGIDLDPRVTTAKCEIKSVLAESVDVGKHSEEAWTVTTTTISPITSSPADVDRLLILSGGDDSALIATSAYLSPIPAIGIPSVRQPASSGPYLQEQSAVLPPDMPPNPPPLFRYEPFRLWTDRKTHTAGVVAILPLSQSPNSSTIPILTGSYDEHIRLFLLDTASPTLKRNLIHEKNLGGGVWRLKLMHESSATPITPTTPPTSASLKTRYTALILASCMHAGVRILRLTHTSPQDSSSDLGAQGWSIDILAKFTRGHESMNYGSDFRAEVDEHGKRTGEYTIVSTSFYDKAVCVWKFVDEEKAAGGKDEEKSS
jgi:diphthine methyl ester acylhydrolase